MGMVDINNEKGKGLAAAVFAFGFWGLAPFFWKIFKEATAVELLLHRVIWGCLILFTIICLKGELKKFLVALKGAKKIFYLFLSAICISINWLVFTYAMVSEHIVEASLGYFINPLMTVFLGRVFLGEFLTPRKWFAIVLATLAVLMMFYGRVEGVEISLALAFTFAFYGLIRKQLDIPSLYGLLFELILAFIPAVIFLFWRSETYLFFSAPLDWKLIYISCGLITIIPLFFFVFGAKRLMLSQIGMVQYLAPLLQLLLGTMVYGEAFSKTHFLSFVLIWLAIAIFLSQDMSSIYLRSKVKRNV